MSEDQTHNAASSGDDGPPSAPYTPQYAGVYIPGAQNVIVHPNVRIGSNVKIGDPSKVKINGISLANGPVATYPPTATTTLIDGRPGFQQTTGIVGGSGHYTQQAIAEPGHIQQSVVVPGTGAVVTQTYGSAGMSGQPGSFGN